MIQNIFQQNGFHKLEDSPEYCKSIILIIKGGKKHATKTINKKEKAFLHACINQELPCMIVLFYWSKHKYNVMR